MSQNTSHTMVVSILRVLLVSLLAGMSATHAQTQVASRMDARLDALRDARRDLPPTPQSAVPEQQIRDTGQVVTGIASYVKWPALRAGLQLCFAGQTRFAATLVDGSAQARSQPIRTARLMGADPAVLSSCDIVYLGTLALADQRKLLGQLRGLPVLSISEPATACLDDVMFCLKIRDEQVAFEANLDVIGKSGLRVHPNVLQLARRKGKP